MTYKNAVLTFGVAVEDFANSKDDYLVSLDFAASQVEEYLTLRSGTEKVVENLQVAMQHAQDSNGDYLGELDAVVYELRKRI